MYANTLPRYTIQHILLDNKNWGKYKVSHPDLNPHIIQEIEKMLDCCNPNKGFFYGYCKHCDKEIICHVKCNGRICNRCGKSYVERWMRKAKKKVISEMHRLVTLTVPADLRPILENRWDLLKILQDSAKQTLEEIANLVCKKKVKIGILVGLQTYGQAINFHPHVHCMVVEKAKHKGELINFNYIPKDILRKKWQYIVLTNLSKANISLKEKQKVHEMFEQYPHGFITDVGRRSMNRSGVIKYLSRYMRHPPIANSRIVYYGKGKVVIKLKDKLGREYHKLFTVEEFITDLIQHIPPKQFRIVRWYGLYSRRDVRLSRKYLKQETIWESLSRKTKTIRCPYCKNPLSYVMYLPNGPPNNKLLKEKLDYWKELTS